MPHVHLAFLMFVFNTAVSYFFSYRRSLIIADQRRYIDTLVHYGCYSLMNVGQIVGLYLTKKLFCFSGDPAIYDFAGERDHFRESQTDVSVPQGKNEGEAGSRYQAADRAQYLRHDIP